MANETELKNYISNPENGLIKEDSIGDYKIKVSYRPSDMLLAQELRSMNKNGRQKADELKKKYDQYCYFILSFSRRGREVNDMSSPESFENSIKLLSFGLKDYVSLRTEADTIPVADYISPRMYGSTGATQSMFVFSKEKIKNADFIDFCLIDFGLEIGNIKFRFDSKNIEKIPLLTSINTY